MPEISYPPELPITARQADIKKAIAENQVVILSGATGSGKTTQLPKICLELGRGIHGLIGHTQPRRIAARTVASRISAELKTELGGIVGYQVRFTEQVSPQTLIKLMTDGILLAEIPADPQLLRYDTIIIDEAHERSLNIDFLLGYLAQLLPQRPDLKLIITSATIDSQRFAQHFGKFVARNASSGGLAPQNAAPGNAISGNAASENSATPAVPVIEVSGRTYPIEIRYRPLDSETTADTAESPTTDTAADAVIDTATDSEARFQPRDQVTGILEAAEELMAEGPGDILVFLSGEGEIRDTEKAFRDHLQNRYIAPGEKSKVPGAVEIMPLYARLSMAEQHRIFTAHPHRRIVLATNIAETSLTVPGIRYVIDPGTARISRYSAKTKVQRLPIEAVSRSAADQRAGRCGRLAGGIAIRLYSEADFLARPQFTEPEIQRTSLASVILQMAALQLGEVADFPFLDPPNMQAIQAGKQLLEEIGALELNRSTPRLTKMGRKLARLPIDPRLGRMLLEAAENGCAAEVLVLVAAMSVQDVRLRPVEFATQADQLHSRFIDPRSDFLAYLNLWRYLRFQQQELSGSQFRRLCQDEYLNWLRFREWQDVVNQLRQLAKPLGIYLKRLRIPSAAQAQKEITAHPETGKNYAVAAAVRKFGNSADVPAAEAIHRSLLTGMLSKIGNWDQRHGNYVGPRGSRFVIWPGSGLNKRNPEWVMASELVETSRLFARTVAQIRPEWIERAAGPLLKTQYSEPYWSARRGAAEVHAKIMLYGLPIIADRRVPLTQVGTAEARALARELFIRHALVEQDWRAPHAFLKQNKQALAEAHESENRRREFGLVADEFARFDFFAKRLPKNIFSGRHFDKWWKTMRTEQPHLLDFTQEFLLGKNLNSEEDFPSEWPQGDILLPIAYEFRPGGYGDGLTIEIPVALLPQLKENSFDWLVPGMWEELTTSTIRALPKKIRRQLVPAPDTAREIIKLFPTWEEIVTAPPSFRKTFTAAARQLRTVEIPEEVWETVELPEHLQMHFRVRSEKGAVLAEGVSLRELQAELAPQARTAVESVVQGAVAKALEEAESRLRQQAASEKAARDSARHATQAAAAKKAEEAAEGRKITAQAAHLSTWPQLPGGEIPEIVENSTPAGVVRGYPALVARKNTFATLQAGDVELRVLSTAAQQLQAQRTGIISLLAGEVALPEIRITTRWNGKESLILAGSPYPDTAALVADLQLAAVRNLADSWGKTHKIPLGKLRSEKQYLELRQYVKNGLEDEIYQLARRSVQIFINWAEVESALEKASISLINPVTDIHAQISQLIYAGFISRTPEKYFPYLSRYLQAAKCRVEKAALNIERDEELALQIAEIAEWIQDLQVTARENPHETALAERARRGRWLLEELRVSFFAQQLGTAEKVSPQRLAKLLRGKK